MPRLLAGGPGLAVSPDHALLAVVGSGRLTLHDAATREESAATHVPAAESDVIFVSTGGALRLLAFVLRQAGFAARKRFLWIAAQQQLEVYRYSDGRLQLRVDLGKRFLAADGHSDSSRVVVALHPEGEPIQLVAFDLALRERRDLEAGHP